MSPTTKNIEPRMAAQVGHPVPGQQLAEHLHVAERRGAHLEPPRRLAAPGDQVVAAQAERALGPGVRVPLGDLEHLGDPGAQRARRQAGQPAGARVHQVQGHRDLVQQALEPGQAVALASG